MMHLEFLGLISALESLLCLGQPLYLCDHLIILQNRQKGQILSVIGISIDFTNRLH